MEEIINDRKVRVVKKIVKGKEGQSEALTEVVSRDRLTPTAKWDLTKLPAPFAWNMAKRFKIPKERRATRALGPPRGRPPEQDFPSILPAASYTPTPVAKPQTTEVAVGEEPSETITENASEYQVISPEPPDSVSEEMQTASEEGISEGEMEVVPAAEQARKRTRSVALSPTIEMHEKRERTERTEQTKPEKKEFIVRLADKIFSPSSKPGN